MSLVLLSLSMLLLLLFLGSPVTADESAAESGESATLVTERVLTLKDCLDLVLTRNPTLKASEYMLASAQQDLKAAQADFLPTLSASSSYTQLRSLYASGSEDFDYLGQLKFNAAVALSQTLYAGRRIVNARDKSFERTRMVEMERANIASQLAYQVKVTFFQLMKAGEDVTVAVDTVTRLRADAAAAEAFYEKELAPYAQVLQARVDLADARQKMSIAENTVDRKRSELFALINEPFNREVTFKGRLNYYQMTFDLTARQCFDAAIQNRSDLKSLDHQLKMLEKDAAIAMARYHPVVKLDVGAYDQDRDYDQDNAYGQSRDQHNTYWSAGINVSWNLFDGGRGWHEKKKYLIEMKRIKEQYREIESYLETEILTSLFSLSEAKQRITTTSEGMAAADEYYERESKRFQAGIATIASVLDAQVRVTRARGSYAQALLDYQLARANLDFMMETPREKRED